MRRHWLRLCLILFLIAGFNFRSVQADTGTVHTYIPIGSDYRSDTLQRFARAAAQHNTNATIDILVIPITFATDPFNISNGERQQNLTLADTRRGQVETARHGTYQVQVREVADLALRPEVYMHERTAIVDDTQEIRPPCEMAA